ncbi:MAG: hypothetical protein JXB39_13080 [Deltaproteobacteria bacterium]|nr:hypothetical protein [Deltaproteobacteria bacterium]
MDTSRNALGTLLSAVAADPRDHRSRVEAAGLALDLCLDLGDPHLADVAEALTADVPDRIPADVSASLSVLGERARAARRAVCLARRQNHQTPRALASGLASDPYALSQEVRKLASRDQEDLARAVLEIARVRFPRNPELEALRRWLSGSHGTPRPGEGGRRR